MHRSVGVSAIICACLFWPNATFAEDIAVAHSATWLSLLPPLLAIGLTLIFRNVIIALAGGVLLGAGISVNGNPLLAIGKVIDGYLLDAWVSRDHATILLFTLLLGGTIYTVRKFGGADGLARVFGSFGSGRMSTMLSTWVMGIVIFFDDYANTLIVGSAMRPVYDRMKISREKLAFIVDATAAPVASVALVSSWVGVEIGFISEQLNNIEGVVAEPYQVFLQTLPYRFYPWLMLLMTLAIIVMRRDFGPMRKAEIAALNAETLSADENADDSDRPTPNLAMAAAPLLTLIVVAFCGMVATGRNAAAAEGLALNARNIFSNAAASQSLLWGATAAFIVAAATAMAITKSAPAKVFEAQRKGVASMVEAMFILLLAWSIGAVCKDLKTADFLIGLFGRDIPAGAIPAVVFILGAVVSFATGSSWGTMPLLFPIAVPFAHQAAPQDPHVMLGAIAAVLTGSVFGDHCSPISDTTVMSSMATGCDHGSHVRTQFPYAISAGAISILVCELPVGLGLYGPWVALILGAICVVAFVRFVGKQPETSTNPSSASATP